jgi:hypothetical protein
LYFVRGPKNGLQQRGLQWIKTSMLTHNKIQRGSYARTLLRLRSWDCNNLIRSKSRQINHTKTNKKHIMKTNSK